MSLTSQSPESTATPHRRPCFAAGPSLRIERAGATGHSLWSRAWAALVGHAEHRARIWFRSFSPDPTPGLRNHPRDRRTAISLSAADRWVLLLPSRAEPWTTMCVLANPTLEPRWLCRSRPD